MIEYYLGIDSDYILVGLAGLTAILLITILVMIIQLHKLKKKYRQFTVCFGGQKQTIPFHGETVTVKLEA